MVDYEKGTAGWDISMMLTRHHVSCARRLTLIRTVGQPAEKRASEANATTCTCGHGDSPAEVTRRA